MTTAFFVVRCVFVLLATVKTCQRKFVNSFTPAKKAYQGKTRQRNLVVRTHELMKIVTDTCHGKIALV